MRFSMHHFKSNPRSRPALVALHFGAVRETTPINGDTFFYWPGGNYPDDTGAGNIERIRDWAYLHE